MPTYYEDPIKTVDREYDHACETQESYRPILEEANKIVNGDRNRDYGHPYDDYRRTADLMTVLLSKKLIPDERISPHEAAMLMFAVKLSRMVNDPTKRDNLVDIAGYSEVVGKILDVTHGLR